MVLASGISEAAKRMREGRHDIALHNIEAALDMVRADIGEQPKGEAA